MIHLSSELQTRKLKSLDGELRQEAEKLIAKKFDLPTVKSGAVSSSNIDFTEYEIKVGAESLVTLEYCWRTFAFTAKQLALDAYAIDDLINRVEGFTSDKKSVTVGLSSGTRGTIDIVSKSILKRCLMNIRDDYIKENRLKANIEWTLTNQLNRCAII